MIGILVFNHSGKIAGIAGNGDIGRIDGTDGSGEIGGIDGNDGVGEIGTIACVANAGVGETKYARFVKLTK